MKVLFLSKYYNNYLNFFYSKIIKGKDYSYNELYNKIIQDRYFWSDYFKQELPAHGYSVEQLIIDAKLLQVKWAEDHQVLYSEDNWYFDILFEQIKYFHPEILFIQDWSSELGPKFISLLKARYPFIKMIIGYCGEGHPSPDYFKYHDVVISCAKDNVEKFNKNGLYAYHIYHAFCPKIHQQLSYKYQKEYDIGFIGRIYPQSFFHEKRALFLWELSNFINFNIHGEIKTVKRYSLLESFYYKIIYLMRHFSSTKMKEKYSLYKKNEKINIAIGRLRKLQKKQYLGLEMFDMVRRYKVLLNFHTSPLFAANLRMFEVTGMGTCLLTDWKENIKELFEPDIEIVTFNNVYEAKEKIDFLKEHPDIAANISLAGQKRTMRDHTYKNRAVDLHYIFTDFFKRSYKNRGI